MLSTINNITTTAYRNPSTNPLIRLDVLVTVLTAGIREEFVKDTEKSEDKGKSVNEPFKEGED